MRPPAVRREVGPCSGDRHCARHVHLFYLSVYDASLDKFYSWPENSTRENSSDIPPPSKWGDIISPDKSLPELNLPILIFGILIFTIILVQSKTKIGVLR